MLSGQEISFFDTLIISATGMLVVMFELVLLMILIVFISKVVNKFSKDDNDGTKKPDPQVTSQPQPVQPVQQIQPAQPVQQNVTQAYSPQSDGFDPEMAAILVAVCEESGTPIEDVLNGNSVIVSITQI